MKLCLVEQVWDKGEHNAFTDLCDFNSALWLCFREAEGHVSPEGDIRILRRADDQSHFSAAALIHVEGIDLRDPKLVESPDGKLLLTCAGVDRSAERQIIQSYIAWSSDGITWSELSPQGEQGMWLWRSRYLNDVAYSVAYNYSLDKVSLYKMDAEQQYQLHVDPLFSLEQNGLAYPNEHDLALLDDGSALCLLRRDKDSGTAQLGSATAPYLNWDWLDLGAQIGGPVMLKLDDGRVLCAVRLYEPVRTSLCWLQVERGQLKEVQVLPSGGDTSYAGLVQRGERIYCSYYSSHHDKTAIYMAELDLSQE
ncbi:sialidase family protein [Agarivorans sp. MS3-6]|uniref:sialidase family protein n=1 Tax=Agarivorans sp. TSD2052 TaxID=2937286 RepID=UPI00200DF402|nr:sialidase family protein [Agarivorans sp. TSD2052]UPW18284.1 glycoside hydrolase [Agarivorans sp. TSD2052]